MSGKGEDAWRARAKRPFLLSPSDFSLFRPRERGPRPRHHPPAESLSPCLLHLHTMRRRDIPVVGGRECSPPQRIIRMSFNMAAHRNYGTERAGERANRRERNARPPIFLPLPFRAGRMLGGKWEEEEGNVCALVACCAPFPKAATVAVYEIESRGRSERRRV